MPSPNSSEPKKPPKRMRLLDHLGDESIINDNLQDASAKIARLSRRHDDSDIKDAPIPLDEVTDSITHSDTDSTPKSPIQSLIQSPIQTPIEAPNQEAFTSEPQRSSGEPVLLTENQAILYICLKQVGGAVTSLNLISQATRISEHTLKSALKKLRQHELIIYGGRKNSGGRFGFTAEAIECPIVLRGDRTRVQDCLRQIDTQDIVFATSLSGIEIGEGTTKKDENQLELELSHLMDHRLNEPPLSSSSFKNKQLLQDLERSLLLEGYFQDLDIRSLKPHLDQFDSAEAVQLFLDMANASIEAAAANAKPIKNPHGFLFAQLRAGYVNPPPGFKSRRVLAQEAMNAQLQAELAELQQLRAQETELRFELFKAGLTDEQRTALEAEAVKSEITGGA